MSNKRHQTHLPIALAASCTLAFACKVGPDYVPPEIETPDAWHLAATEGFGEGEAALHTWWTTLEDPVLDDLIQRAGHGNLDLGIAFARLRAARAVRGIATGERFPDVNGSAFLERSRTSETINPVLPSGISRTDDFFGVGTSASWEVDVWGRVSRLIEAADAALQASVEDYRDVLVTLYAQVGITYVEVRALQSRITHASNNIELQRSTLQLTSDRFDAGIAPELDVRQAELNLANTESVLPILRQGLAFAIHRLGVLLGEGPDELRELLGAEAPIPAPTGAVATGMPADILRQRPDVRAAERALAAETADIGVATAALYPMFTLNGTLALEATSDLLDARNKVWSFGPQFVWNLFDGGRVRNAIHLEEAEAEGALYQYENTVLLALEEVENAMVAFVEEGVREEALDRSVVAAQRSVELVQELYRTGLTDFQNVLDTERFLAEQQDDLAESQGRVVQNLIDLYRALGGGWDPGPPELAEEIEDQANGEPIL